MNQKQIHRLLYLLDEVENKLEPIKNELLVAMQEEQDYLNRIKFDRTDYHHFKNHDAKRVDN